jgi:hypothetical protein
MTQQEKEQIELDFAKLIVKKMTDYADRLGDSKISDREYKHMRTAITGCKRVVQGVINEGEQFEVKLV